MPGTGAAASYGDLLITSLVVLAAVCVAAFVAVRFVGRFLATGRVRGAHLLDVVARVPLEPRRSLYVVEVAGKTLLVGTSEMGLSVLTELDGGEVRARTVPRQSFSDLVRAAWQRRSSGPTASAADQVDGGAAAETSGAGRASALTLGHVAQGGAHAREAGRDVDTRVGHVAHGSAHAREGGRDVDTRVGHVAHGSADADEDGRESDRRVGHVAQDAEPSSAKADGDPRLLSPAMAQPTGTREES